MGQMPGQIILLLAEPVKTRSTYRVKWIKCNNSGTASWDNLYVTIARANFAIKYIPDITELSEVQRNNYLAQAYGIRAYMYFWAVSYGVQFR